MTISVLNSLSLKLLFSSAILSIGLPSVAEIEINDVQDNVLALTTATSLSSTKQELNHLVLADSRKQEGEKENKENAKEEKNENREESATERLHRRLTSELNLHDEQLRAKHLELNDELQRLQWENQLITEKLNNAKLKRDEKNQNIIAEYEEKLVALTREKELLTETLAIAKVKQEQDDNVALAEYEKKINTISREKELLAEQLEKDKIEYEITQRKEQEEHNKIMAKYRQESEILQQQVQLLSSKLELQDADSKIKITKLESELLLFSSKEKREQYADSKVVYLEDPLTKDGTLIISDRRIALNGAITRGAADYVSERINFFNNKTTKYPIFIVIDASPGGSVLEGLRIIRAMQGSEAPVYVLVKSLAASMAATIVALAERSFSYPNAYFVHHQISSMFFGRLNLTQKKEFYDNARRLWVRLAKPVTDKMGITTDEFIKKMYEKSTSGDWVEFGSDAKELKWVDHIVTSVRETSLIVNPDYEKQEVQEEAIKTSNKISSNSESLDEQGKPFTYLPRLFSHDYYYLYNPDDYYRVR